VYASSSEVKILEEQTDASHLRKREFTMADVDYKSGGGYSIPDNTAQAFYFWSWTGAGKKNVKEFFDVTIWPEVPGTLRINRREVNLDRDSERWTLMLEVENLDDSEMTFTANHVIVTE
jgi:hypothetical protein